MQHGADFARQLSNSNKAFVLSLLRITVFNNTLKTAAIIWFLLVLYCAMNVI